MHEYTNLWVSLVGRCLIAAALAVGLTAVVALVAYKQAYRPPTAIEYDRQQQCLSRHIPGCDATSPTELAVIDAEGSSGGPAFLAFLLVLGVGTWFILRSYHRPGLASGILASAVTGMLVILQGARNLGQPVSPLSIEDVVSSLVLGWVVCTVIAAAAVAVYPPSLPVKPKTRQRQ